MASPLKAISRLFAEAKADVSDLRARLADLEDQRRRVVEMPRDRASVEAMIDATIAKAQAERPFALGALWSVYMSPGEAPGMLKDRLQADPMSVFAAWDPDRFKALLLASAPEGISETKRAAELSKLDRDILLTSIAEEVACRELDAEIGRRYPRRRDAEPAILFAPTSELERGAK